MDARRVPAVDEYLQFMYERLILIRELLSEKGSLFVHCDRCSQHLLRCLLDEVFGASVEEDGMPGLVNEIVWHHPPELVNQNDRFASSHDTIFWYSKTGKHFFNEISIAKSDLDELEAKESRVPGTVWSMDAEAVDLRQAVGYLTQKPEALLERIMLVASAPGSIVMDCFMGSGTTGAVAMRMGRRFLLGGTAKPDQVTRGGRNGGCDVTWSDSARPKSDQVTSMPKKSPGVSLGRASTTPRYH